MKPTKDVETSTVATTPSDAEVAKNGYHSIEPSPVFHCFLKLPAELRSQIYHDVASHRKSGCLNLFSTSKQMRNEGAVVSARYFSFRLWLGWNRRDLPRDTLDWEATAVIQNVFLRFRLKGSENIWSTPPRPFDYRLIGFFGRSQVMRESCQIVLDYDRNGYLSTSCACTTLFNAIRQLTNFRTVTIGISYDEVGKSNRHFRMIISIRNTSLYAQRVNAALEPALGPATLGVNEFNRYLQELHFNSFAWKFHTDQHSDPA